MARWEPNTRLKLIDAAAELFAADGYEATTVAQIAARAGVSKMTFFRHFPDKREVLFAGREIQGRLLREAVCGAEEHTSTLDMVSVAVGSVAAVFPDERRAPTALLMRVVASHEDLRERAAFKQVYLADTLTAALVERGVPAVTAAVAADLGVRALHEGMARWADSERASFSECVEAVFAGLRQAVVELAAEG